MNFVANTVCFTGWHLFNLKRTHKHFGMDFAQIFRAFLDIFKLRYILTKKLRHIFPVTIYSPLLSFYEK